jgi:hypothetical protein
VKRVIVGLLAVVIAGSSWWLGLIPGTPTYQLPTTGQTSCQRIRLSGVSLHGSPDYSRLAWIGFGGNRVDVVWPPGYWARFDPWLEVFDAAGRLVAGDLSRVTSACMTDDRTIELLDATSFPSDPAR